MARKGRKLNGLRVKVYKPFIWGFWMKGNTRLGLTAELAALIRAEKGTDRYSKHFVTPRARRIYAVTKHIVSEKKIQEIFEKRAKLSEDIHRVVEEFKPEQVIELASGSSVFGLEYSQAHLRVVYIETDLERVIRKKEGVLEQVLEAEGMEPSPNHVLVPVDVLSDDIYKALKEHIKKGKRTLVIAQGLTSYFSPEKFEVYMQRIVKLLGEVDGEYLSHETLGEKMTSGIGGRILRAALSFVTGGKSYQHFHSLAELRADFKGRGLTETKGMKSDSGSYIFIVKCK
jgi:O-methyltransferase involved in polyketide biosynthesis